MPLTGTIGTTSSLKSDGPTLHRRSLPEPVVSFHLPTVKRSIPPSLSEKQGRKGKGVLKEDVEQKVDGEVEQLSIESRSVCAYEAC
jgi:hypothetical protein